MTHASVPKKIRESIGIKDGLIRISVGIENDSDLISDLERALRKSNLFKNLITHLILLNNLLSHSLLPAPVSVDFILITLFSDLS